MKAITICIIALLCIQLSESLPIVAYLKKGQSFCFRQQVPRHTLVNFTVTSGYAFNTRISFMNKVLYQQGQSLSYTEQFTTQKHGSYQFCITNFKYDQTITPKFDLKVGQDAKDFEASQHQSSIQQLNRLAILTQNFLGIMKNQTSTALQTAMVGLKGPRSFYPIFYSIFFLVITLIITYSQFYHIRKVLTDRKYI